MKDIPISRFKTNCAALLKRIEREKSPVRITRRGKAIAEILVTKPAPCIDRAKFIGSMKDTITILGDIIAPAVDEDEWECLRD